jgi:hypothetical protein
MGGALLLLSCLSTKRVLQKIVFFVICDVYLVRGCVVSIVHVVENSDFGGESRIKVFWISVFLHYALECGANVRFPRDAYLRTKTVAQNSIEVFRC